MARPSKYSEKLVDRMLEEIASGRSVIGLCREEEWTPNADTWYRWLYKIEGLSDRYARAKSHQSEREADIILDIADNATNQDYQVARLRVDARKWIASKLLPNKYGERTQIDHSSTDGSMKPTVIELVGKK
tara:strand:- start:237 stop:629 length:393 start_codon:yes stop_codon:yes gene_type:complete